VPAPGRGTEAGSDTELKLVGLPIGRSRERELLVVGLVGGIRRRCANQLALGDAITARRNGTGMITAELESRGNTIVSSAGG
jgi:hypothetical protein